MAVRFFLINAQDRHTPKKWQHCRSRERGHVSQGQGQRDSYTGVIRQRGRKICHKKKGKETEGIGRQSNRNKKAERAFKGWSEETSHSIKLYLRINYSKKLILLLLICKYKSIYK